MFIICVDLKLFMKFFKLKIKLGILGLNDFKLININRLNLMLFKNMYVYVVIYDINSIGYYIYINL